MLHLLKADRPAPLVAALAEVLASPLDDPFSRDWVAVPTEGLRRWLQLQLARRLGASSDAACDGVTANIAFAFPGALRRVVLDAGLPEGSTDPWHLEHLTWAVLEVLHAHSGDRDLGPLDVLPPGATWFGRARRLADLFDRYSVHRPELVRRWAAGSDVDCMDSPLPPHQLWQPRLWRLTRDRIGQPSPPERLPALLERLRDGDLDLDLPPRLAMFGITTLPGGAPFIELADAIASRRELHLLLLDPSPVASDRVWAEAHGAPRGGAGALARNRDRTDRTVANPLVRSWARPHRESIEMLGLAAIAPKVEPTPGEPPAGTTTPATLLARLQADIRADAAPVADFVPAPDDRSVQIHSCHGPTRQVEVARDALLHLLADDPTLDEDDIVVLCPSIDEFAPLIEAAFGVPADDSATTDAPHPADSGVQLAYRITDRSLRATSAVLAALASLLDLLGGRFQASAVVDFISCAPVRERFGLGDEALASIDRWVADTNVRWGLDGRHREAWGLPARLTANSWQAAIDRVVMGVAVSDDPVALAPGDIAPLGVEGDDIAVAGRLADILARLSRLAGEVSTPRPPAAWSSLLIDACDELFAPPSRQSWQIERVRRILTELTKRAAVGERPCGVELDLTEVRRALGEHLRGGPRRPDFFRGGVTISSLTPLRWVPFRVVCVLGLDEGSLGTGSPDGDDLTALAPQIGDRDERADSRQALLEAILSARDHLVITRTGHDVRTNQSVPHAVALCELRDQLVATLATEARTKPYPFEFSHPRHRFDDDNFLPGRLGSREPWSFDTAALDATRARAARDHQPRAFLEQLLAPDTSSMVELDDLRSFLTDPVGHFLERRLQIRLPRGGSETSDDLPVHVDGLTEWRLGTTLAQARRTGRTNDQWGRVERARGSLPTGRFADGLLDSIGSEVDSLLDSAATLDVELDAVASQSTRREIAVQLGDDTMLVGSVALGCGGDRPGPAHVLFKRPRPTHLLGTWIDLLALAACDPATEWRAVLVTRGEKRSDAPCTTELVVRGRGPRERERRAREGLEIALDCFRRGSREPLPLFPRLSPALAAGEAKASLWRAYGGSGDGDEPACQLVFGDIALDDLLAVRAFPDDPPGSSRGRALRYAKHLWGAFDESVEEVTR